MENSFDRIIDVLGKPLTETLLNHIGEDLKDEYEVFKTELVTIFCFPKTGVSFKCFERWSPGTLTYAGFHLATPSVESGKLAKYSGNLSGGVKAGDSENKVATLLGSRYDRGDYRLEPYKVSFFSSEMKSQFISVSIFSISRRFKKPFLSTSK